MLFLAKYFGFDIQFLNHNQDFSDPNQRAFVDCSVRNLFSGMSLQTRSSVWFFRTRHKEVWSSKGTGASLFEEIYHIYNTKKQQTVPLTSANSVQPNQEWVFLLFYLKKKPEFTMYRITRGFLFIHLFIHVFVPAQGRPSCALRLHSPCNIGTEYRFCHKVIVFLWCSLL